MRRTYSYIAQAKFLFYFLSVTSCVVVGYYNYLLVNQTRRVENLLTFWETQESKIRIIHFNSSRISEHTGMAVKGNATVKRTGGSNVISNRRLTVCRVNVSSVNWMKIPYSPTADDFRNDTVLSGVRYGGLYSPYDCRAKEKIAIIVSYRDREEHLEIFLNYMHAFLQKQQLQYGIYVVELTRRVENLLTFWETQESKIRIIHFNSSRISEHTGMAVKGNATVKRTGGSNVISNRRLTVCRVNVSSVNWMKIPYSPTADDFRNDTVLSGVRYGGLYSPYDCRAKEKIAIIVSYRDREEHLEIFLNYMHAFLQKQQLQYGIYVVELALPTQFNRGLLNNIGYETARSIAYYDCYIFHDVDLLPKYINNYYSCSDGPVHFAARNMKYNFMLPYKGYTGGVFGMNSEAFETVNGFSNLYFGWGREDDDFRKRVEDAGYTINRPQGRTGTYIALPHTRDTSNPKNPDRGQLYRDGMWRSKADGLNSMMYSRLALEFRELYTWIYVQANEAIIMKDYQSWKDRVKNKYR